MRKTNQILKKINKIQESTPNAYEGKVIRIAPLKIKGKIRKGSTVITPRGLGVIINQWPDIWDGKPGHRAHIQLKRHPKAFYIEDLLQLAIYHKPADQNILLSPLCYNYIGEVNQIVRYRLTNRGYAMLTDTYKKEAEKYEIINKIRNGNAVLKNLQKKGYIIKHPNEENLTWQDIKILTNHILSKFKISIKKQIENTLRKSYDLY